MNEKKEKKNCPDFVNHKINLEFFIQKNELEIISSSEQETLTNIFDNVRNFCINDIQLNYFKK